MEALMRWLAEILLMLMASAGSMPPVTQDPFTQTAKWSAQESWNNEESLVYTFQPDGTFTSSDWDGGKGQGTWELGSQGLTMRWPQYGAIYCGIIGDGEIRGIAYSGDGRLMGTFIFHAVR
jgi:hypothetical protein